MRKMMKKMLSLLMACLMLMTMLPQGAVTAQTLGLQRWRQLGGLEAHVSSAMDGGQVEIVKTWENRVGDFMTMNEDPDLSVYVSMEEAVDSARQQMAARMETVEIYVLSEDSNPQNIVNEVMGTIFDHTGDARFGDTLRWQYATGTVGANGFMDNFGNCYYTVSLIFAYYTTAEQEAAMDIAVKALLDELNVYGADDYHKVRAVYDWMCNNITYDFANLDIESYKLKFTPYAALINRTSVCQGYALLFYRLMLELGVDARFIAGVGGGGAHSWNIVELDDLYYNLDATWDADMPYYNYFLVSDANFTDHVRNDEYRDAFFYALYPMGAEDYVYVEPGCSHEQYVYYASVEPDCVFEGNRAYYYCPSCGAMAPDAQFTQLLDYYKDIYIGPIGHDFVGGFCQSCGELDPNAAEAMPCGDDVVALYDEQTGVLSIVGTGPMWDFASVLESPPDIGRMALQVAPWVDGRIITKVVIGAGVTYIGSNAFAGCGMLMEVDFAENCEVTGIGSYAFDGCMSLNISIPDGVTYIGEYAFRMCDIRGELLIPASVEQIGNAAFSNNAGITNIVFAAGSRLHTISENAFANCYDLNQVQLPAGLQSLAFNAFSGCTALENVHVDAANAVYASVDGVVYTKDMKTLLIYAPGRNKESFVVPNGVTKIGEYAFANCVYLKNVQLPEGVTEIGKHAFSRSKSLQSVQLPQSLVTIGSYAFYNDAALNSIRIPAAVQSIGLSAFWNCTSLREIYIDSADVVATLTLESACGYLLRNAYNVYILTAIADVPDYVLERFPDVLCMEIGGVAYTLYSHIHSFDIPHRAEPATCEQAGFEVYRCLCGHEKMTEIPALGHNYEGNREEVDRLPTCDVPGSKTIVIYCTNCEKDMTANTRNIDPLGHTYENGVCTVCGKDIVLSGVCGDEATWSFDPETGVLTISGTGAVYDYIYQGYFLGWGEYAPWFTFCEDIQTVRIGAKITEIGRDAFHRCEDITDVWVYSDEVAQQLIGWDACGGLIANATTIRVYNKYVPTDYIFENYPYSWMENDAGDVQYCFSQEPFPVDCAHENLDMYEQAPTCEKEGKKGIMCADCGCILEYTTIEPMGHDYESNICVRCGAEKQAVIIAQGVCGNDLTWKLDEDGVLTISGTGDMYNYGENGMKMPAPWDDFREWILELNIADTVTTIGFEAFVGCTGLTKVVISGDIWVIGYGAFMNCTNLRTLIIDENSALRSSYNRAFEGCYNLYEVYIYAPELTQEGVAWFDNCGMLDYAEYVYVYENADLSEELKQWFACDGEPKELEEDGKAVLVYLRGTHRYMLMEYIDVTCLETSQATYLCTKCEREDVLFPEEPLGHDWDENHTCTHCGEVRRYIYEDVVVLGDLVLVDGVYYTKNGEPAVIAIEAPLEFWLGGSSLADYVRYYGEERFSMTYWNDLEMLLNPDGFVPLTEETLIWILDLITGNPNWGDDDDCLTYYLGYAITQKSQPEIPEHAHIWDEMGICRICCEIWTPYTELVVEELVKAEDDHYTTETGEDVYIDMEKLALELGLQMPRPYGKLTYVRKDLVTMTQQADYWAMLLSCMNDDGYTLLTEETLQWLNALVQLQDEPAAAEEYLATKPAAVYEHHYQAEVVEATCTADGYTIYTCTCGDSYITDRTVRAPHADQSIRDHLCDFCGATMSDCVTEGTCDWCGAGVASALRGDVDGDGDVDSDDAIYLLYYTFKPYDYPLNQSGDMDGDGDVDSDDAIYLLYYTFKPDDYPLH